MNIHTLAFLQNLSAPELIIIFLIVLLLFGAKRLPGLFKSFGESIKEFKKATSGIENDIRSAMDTEDEPVRKPRAASNKVDSTPAAPETEAPKSEAPAPKTPEA